jgi:uncharacterized membrane protein YdjX (TVP38/TMEM64 family)
MHFLGLTGITREQVQNAVSSAGAVAPIVFIALTFLQVTIVPIPSAVTIVAGSYVFGPWLSFIYSYIGLVLGSMFAFFLGKRIGRPFVNWIAGDAETANGWIERLCGRERVLLYFMFFLPAFPDDLLCAIAGMFNLTYREFFVMQLLTRTTSVAGTLFFMSGEVIPYNGWGIALILAVGLLALILFVLCMKHYEAIKAFLDRLFRKNNQ